jgi:ParB-like chromosome segregation protein Spo0J
LNLTEEQKERMRSLRVAFSDKTRAARMTANSLNDEKNNMIASGKIDMKRLAAIDEEIVKARSEVMRAQLQMQRERLSALTEEQIKRLGDLTSRRGDMNPGPGMHHGGHRMGKGRMGGMGGVL